MSGGYRTYLSHLVPLLVGHPQVEALLVGMPQTIDTSEWQRTAPSAQWLSLRCSLRARGREVSREARKAIGGFSPDVVFIPTARHFALNGTPVVNMVRNMMPMTPHYSLGGIERLQNWARFRQMREAVERSSRVIAVSQFVRDHLVARVGLEEARIGVVYHGTDTEFQQPLSRPAAIPDDLSCRFVFAAGEIYPYRGLEDLLAAWGHLRDGSDPPPLVIAGRIGQGMSRYYRKLVRLVEESDLASHVHFVGSLSQTEMAWCYQSSLAFIMTSRVEACPNIALEAMAHGCVCISTDNPPMPEMFADAAVYYPFGDARLLADRIQEMLEMSDVQRRRFRERVLCRATQFSWTRCVEQTIAELAVAGKALA